MAQSGSEILLVSSSGENIEVNLKSACSIWDVRLRVATAWKCCPANIRIIPRASVSAGVLTDDMDVTKLSSKELTVVSVPAIFWRSVEQHGGQGFCWNSYTCNCSERILLSPNLQCTLVSINNEDSSSSMVNTQVVQWDVLLGTYEVQDGAAWCAWNSHFHRKYEFAGGMASKPKDESSWECKGSTSSFKWQRIELPHCIPEVAQYTVMSQLDPKANLFEQDMFAKLGENDLRHFNCRWWEMNRHHKNYTTIDTTLTNIPARLLKEPLNTYEQRLCEEKPADAPHACVIENDVVPMAMAQAVVQWQRASEDAESRALGKIRGDLVGWDFDGGSIIGIPLTVQLVTGDGSAFNHHDQYGPPSEEATVDGKMSDLLELVEQSAK